MTSVYVLLTPDEAKMVHDRFTTVNFVWRMVRYNEFDVDLYRIEYDSFPPECENKLVQLVINEQTIGKPELTCIVDKNQKPLSILRARKKRK